MVAAWPFTLASIPWLLGCAETAQQGPLPGASDAWAHEPRAATVAQEPRAPILDGYAEVQHWPLANAAPFVSLGHQPEQLVDVRLNDSARAGYDALVADSVFADGAALAELSNSGSGLGYLMQKAGGNWSYTELDARGGVLASGGLTACAGCHAQVLSDHVFGLPRPD